MLLVLLLLLVVIVLRTLFISTTGIAFLVFLASVLGVALRRTKWLSWFVTLKNLTRLSEPAELWTGKQTSERTSPAQHAAEPARLPAVDSAKWGRGPS